MANAAQPCPKTTIEMVVPSANDVVILDSDDFVIVNSNDFVIAGSNDFVILGLTRDPSVHHHGCRIKSGMTARYVEPIKPGMTSGF